MPKQTPTIKQDFMDAFFAHYMGNIEEMVADSVAEIIKNKSGELEEIILNVLNEHKTELLGFIKKQAMKGDKGEAGKDGNNGRDGLSGPQGLRGEAGKDGSSDSPIQIADKLNELTEKVEIEVIKGLKKKLEELEKLQRVGGGRMLGGVLNVGVRIETPVGTIDGANTSFTIFKIPKWICVDGVNYFESNGYTLSGKTLTVTVAPTGFIRSFY